MRSEEATAARERYLSLGFRLSHKAFEADKKAVLRYGEENPERLTESMLATLNLLREFSLSEKMRALVIHHCYADVPGGRLYDLAFHPKTLAAAGTRAILLFGLFWNRLATGSLEHGHHQVAVLDFPDGVPEIIDGLPEDTAPAERRHSNAGLCSLSDWSQISTHLRSGYI